MNYCGRQKFSRLSRKQNSFFSMTFVPMYQYCHIVRCFYPRNNSHTYQSLQFFVLDGACVLKISRKYIVRDKTFKYCTKPQNNNNDETSPSRCRPCGIYFCLCSCEQVRASDDSVGCCCCCCFLSVFFVSSCC